MEFTGERVVPGKTEPDLLNEHIARYRFAEGLVGGRRVLDAGCGTGYGSAILAKHSASVVGVDISREAVEEARKAAPDARFFQGDCAAVGLRDASVDVVVAFEVIEHLAAWQSMLEEARRVLRPDGQLIVSTPNRPEYAKTRDEPNPFHVHEFDYTEYRQALEAVFPHVTIFLENHTQAIAFTPLARQGQRTTLENEQLDPEAASFFLAVCSAQPLYGSPTFLYVPSIGNTLGVHEKHIAKLKEELGQKNTWLQKATAELDELTKTNVAEQAKAQAAIEKLEAEIEEKNQWAADVDREMEEARASLAKLETEFEERTAYAAKVEADRQETLKNYAALETESESRLRQLQDAISRIDELEKRVVERTQWAERSQEQLNRVKNSRAYRLAKTIGWAPKLS